MKTRNAPYYRSAGSSQPKLGSLASSIYQSDALRVRGAYTAWSKAQTLSDYVEETLMQSILNFDNREDTLLVSDYRAFLVQYLHALTVIISDDAGALLDQPQQCFVQFLAEPRCFDLFVELDQGFKTLTWLCIHASSKLEEDINAEVAASLSTLVNNMVGRTLANPDKPTTKMLIDALYGQGCWEVYSVTSHCEAIELIWNSDLPLMIADPLRKPVSMSTQLPKNIVEIGITTLTEASDIKAAPTIFKA